MKDPCCLFYWNDWEGGTRTLSRYSKACYMELLGAQFNSNNDTLTLDEIKIVLGDAFESEWKILLTKFTMLPDGTFRNARLLFEKQRRQKYTVSRRKNLQATIDIPDDCIYRKFDHLLITKEEYKKLLAEGYTEQVVNSILDGIENFNGNSKYKSLYLTAKNWLRKEPKGNIKKSRNQL